MTKVVSIAVVALALILVGGSSRADNTGGVCNSIIAGALGPAQQVVNGVGDFGQQCMEVAGALGNFLFTPGCLDAVGSGEIRGLGLPAVFYQQGQKAGQLKPLGEVICGAICGCGLFGLLPEEPAICPTFDCP